MTMFPRRKSKVVSEKRLMAFRCPVDLAERIDDHHRRGYDKTEVISAMLQLAAEIEAQLSEAEFEAIDEEAHRAKVPRGAVFATLVKEALAGRRARTSRRQRIARTIAPIRKPARKRKEKKG